MCLDVQGGHHHHNAGARHDGVEGVPIVSCAHELDDDASKDAHEQPDHARHDRAIGAVRKEEAQGEGGRNEEAASAHEEGGGEREQCQTLQRDL